MFKTIKRVIDWTGEFKSNLYIGFVFSIFSTIFTAMPTMIAAYTLGLIIDDMRGIKQFDQSWILKSILFIALFVFLRFLFDYLRARYQESIGYELAARDRLKVGDMLKHVSLGYFAKHNIGDILNDVTTGLDTLENMGIRMIDNFVSGYLVVIFMFICFLFFNYKIALIAALGVLLSAVFLRNISKLSRRNAVYLSKANQDLSNAAVEYARGLSIVKSFGQAGASIKSMRDACADSRKINIKTEESFTPSNCMHLIVLKLGSVGIVISSAYLAMTGEMDMPTMLMFCMFSFSIFEGVETISDSAHVLSVIDNAMDRLDSLKKEQTIDDTGRDINPKHHDIEFKNVSFSYDSRPVIKNASFKVKENTTTAIVGPSGSGKSTLCNLIAKFYDVDSGAIYLGGHNIEEYTCDSLLRNISMVFQNVYLFHDTIMNNIRFGNPDATDEEVYEVAKKARCHDFIMNQPDGYNTVIGEGGSTLSGGEKQRISIARAILKDSPIIILDEATASIDPENEHLIQSAISELTNGKTIIIIAHRIATIENADQIVVVKDGQIDDIGTHNELISHDGVYKRFIDIRKSAENWQVMQGN